MQIISLNAWGGAMFDELARWLDGCEADVLCLQEVTHTPALHGWTRFDDAERSLPQRANLLADVRSRLPRHQGLFAASDSGPVQDQDRRAHRQDFGVATFVAEPLSVVGLRTAFVHGGYVDHRDGWPSDGRPRAALAVRVFDPEARRFVSVVNLHGLRDARGKADTPARRAQAERLAELVGGVRENGDLTVVCGDLNLLPGSETFQVLAGLGLVDLVREGDTRTSRYLKPVRHASYLLVSDPAAVKRFEIMTAPEVSDHRALVLDLRP
ncbi:endonuclease/exonuclease/phosphatase family protein [Nonomuraea jiangxiensis]|uniref:Metal-dependent hydrolase, endonuclease/exonuclease/phosphatase family n=1 Tax=Nonomuraea jiangxiensis TaxID=633440 RepID=A0A1G9B4G6_9ACTN|nr:endonuclease/exonuclease/phosphatase family protein [Nonomuraea jiangxiensis]SDK34422.1 Metal-dependent hydrolase, endonuclease/exonuclease/phosphatase family [Nonomuraea jiangxiensis]